MAGSDWVVVPASDVAKGELISFGGQAFAIVDLLSDPEAVVISFGSGPLHVGVYRPEDPVRVWSHWRVGT
jgi:hypothetical protein